MLYYINGDSHLIDPGYYSPSNPLSNSEFNEYRDHSVMHHTYNIYGGLDSPDTNFGLQRKVSDHTEM